MKAKELIDQLNHSGLDEKLSLLYGADADVLASQRRRYVEAIQAFVPHEKTEAYRENMDALFGTGSCHLLRIRPVGGIKIV